MGAAAVPAAIYAGGTLLQSLTANDPSTEVEYESHPLTYTLPSGAKITLYKNTPVGETTKSNNTFGSVLGQVAGAGAKGYAAGSMLGDSETPQAVENANFPNYVEDWYK